MVFTIWSQATYPMNLIPKFTPLELLASGLGSHTLQADSYAINAVICAFALW